MNMSNGVGQRQPGVQLATGLVGAACAAPQPSPTLTEQSGGVAERNQLSVKWQIVVLVTFMVAVLASHFLDSYMAGGHTGDFYADWSWRYLLFAAIVTFTSFPVAYDRARQSKDVPTLVQIGLIFLTGMGWDKLLSTLHYVAIGKAVP